MANRIQDGLLAGIVVGKADEVAQDTTIPENTLVFTTDELSDYLLPEDIADLLNNVTYEPSTHIITFKRVDGPDITLDLPIEALIENIELDDENNLVLYFEFGGSTSIPLNTLLVGVVKKVNGQDPNSAGEITIAYEDLIGIPDLFSGDYNDLTNKPTKLSHFQNDLNFVNDSDLEEFVTRDELDDELEDYAKKEELNDFITKDGLDEELEDYAKKEDLDDYAKKDELFNKDYNELDNLPELKPVSTSGDYNDLINKPVIPTKLSDLVNDNESMTREDVLDLLRELMIWDEEGGED